MRKKLVRMLLFGALALSTISYVGCKDYDDDIDNLKTQIDANKSAIEAVEAAVKSGKFVVSYTPTANGYELKLSDGSTLVISNGANGKDGKDGVNGSDGANGKSVIPKFKVSADNYWMVSTDDGANYEYVLDQNSNKVNATGKDGAQGPQGPQGPGGSDATANVTINKDGYIVIGDVVTSIRHDVSIPSIVINEVDGLYVINLNGQEYKLLAEGSAYNGLQSVVYRRQASDDVRDFVHSIKLMSSQTPSAELLATSSAIATFKVWPATLDLGKAIFDFTDTYKTRSAAPALTYVPGSAKWLDGKEGILSIAMVPQNIATGDSYASSLDITINGHTTASDYFNFQALEWTPANLRFVHTYNTTDVPASVLANITPTTWFDNTYPEYTFVYNESYNLNDSVALGANSPFQTMEDLGFAGINVEFKQTTGKAKGIFTIDKGVVAAKENTQASAINEVCYVTATYKSAEGKVITSYDFAVKAVRERSVIPAPVDIILSAKDASNANKLANLAYSTVDQRVELDVRKFLADLGGRDYMSDNSNTTALNFDLYYLSEVNGNTYANTLTVSPYLVFTPGVTTDKDKLELVVPAGTIINGAKEFYSYETWPGANPYQILPSEAYNWRKSTTTHAVNGSTKQFTLKLNDAIKCERIVTITQNSAFVVNGSTTIVGEWDEAAKAFTMKANLEDLYQVAPTTETVEYKLAAASEQSAKVQAVYSKLNITNNVITVAPTVDVASLGSIKIEAFITGTNIKAVIKDQSNAEVSFCEPVLRSPLDKLTSKASIDWAIDGAANKTINVGEKAEVKMLDRDLNVSTKNVVIEKGQIKTPWNAAYGIAPNTIKYEITGYNKTLNNGTFTINATTGLISCNNTAIVSNVDIYVKVTVSHNWGKEVVEKITVKASLQ